MSKRLIAAFLITLFVLSAALIAIPVQAHTTLGRPTADMPYRTADSEVNPNHVPGPIAYVFPGGGKDWWTGSVPAYLAEPPGYQSPWGVYPANPPSSTWWQLRGNAYAPFGAILTSMEDMDNVGDLVFAIKFWPYADDQGTAYDFEEPEYVYDTVYIYVAPEFDLSGASIATTFDTGGADPCTICTAYDIDITAETSRSDIHDPFGPGWWILNVPGQIKFTETTDIDNDGVGFDETYYVRLNSVAAPKIAGRYLFKVFLNDSFPLGNVAGADGTVPIDDTAGEGEFDDLVVSTMPVENWPVLLVKGEIDPGIAEGSIRFGTWDPNLVEQNMMLPGRVRFVGEAYDPYTWQGTGRMVEARGYFNASAQGHWEVEGIAPGVYDVYASAAGYPEELQFTGVEVHPGKSVHLDLKLNPGAIVCGTIYAKHAFGDVYWGAELPVQVEIYDSNEWPAAKPGYSWGNTGGAQPEWVMWEGPTYPEEWTDIGYQNFGHLKTYSPINLTDSPYTSYVNGPQALWARDSGVLVLDATKGVSARAVAFPWEGIAGLPMGLAGKDPFGIHNGVGPAQTWFTEPDSKTFDFCFGNKDYGDDIEYGIGRGVYGAPTEMTGHIPQVFATWMNGLTPGTYYLRAWITGFVQTDAGGNYVDYVINVADREWAGDIYVPMDLQLNGYINKTVHFQRLPGIIKQAPIGGPDDWRFLIAEARDEQGTLVAFNFTQVKADQASANIQLRGFGMAGPVLFDDWDSQNPDGFHRNELPSSAELISPVGMHFSLRVPRGIHDYGMMPGTYKVYVYMRGYVQQEFEMASVSLSGAPTIISNHMYLGAGINFTIYSIDWEHPRVDRNWQHGTSYTVTVEVFNDNEMKMGEVFYWDDSAGTWAKPVQDDAFNTLPHAGWEEDDSKLKFNGSVHLERFGPDETIGAWTRHPNDEQSTYWWSTFRWALGFLRADWAYRDADLKTTVALETGTYSFNVMTYGYVFKDADKYTLYATKGGQADTKLNVMIGICFRVDILFKKEGIISQVPYDTAVAVAFFDENGNYVAGAYPYAQRGVTTVGAVTYGDRLNADTWYGIDGYPNYVGDWTVAITTFRMPTGDNVPTGSWWITDIDDYGLSNNGYNWNTADWFPPPAVLIGYWGDPRPGPYELRTEIIVPNVHLFGEASIVFELDELPLLTGQLAGFSWSDELRTISWATVTISGAAGEFSVSSFDGKYEMFAPRGDYDLTIEYFSGDQGFTSQTVPITAPDGGTLSYNFLNMERSNIPVPEFPVTMLVALAAIGASLFIFRKARKK